MGSKISVVHGVKSDHFYDQGNAINEIWVGDVEIVSRLPFGDSDQEQAGWPAGGVPKIPWHQFIIPLHKRNEAGNMSAIYSLFNTSPAQHNCEGWLPENGYLGMYTGIKPEIAETIAYTFFCFAIFLFVKYAHVLMCGFCDYTVAQLESEVLSEHGVDETETKRQFRYRFLRSVVLAGLLLALSALFVILALPALLAAAQKRNAADYIFPRAVVICVGSFLGFVLIPTWVIATRKSDPNVTRCEKEFKERAHRVLGAELRHSGNGTKGSFNRV